MRLPAVVGQRVAVSCGCEVFEAVERSLVDGALVHSEVTVGVSPCEHGLEHVALARSTGATSPVEVAAALEEAIR